MWLLIKVALFTLVAPGTLGVYLPRYLALQAGDAPASWTLWRFVCGVLSPGSALDAALAVSPAWVGSDG